ncbi:MAG: Peptidoglycan-binding LysM [Verrucomicrobia bacterium]|nr:Peptidoglycan-binding LysM [Verrucomicrobiota bacterium]
MRKRLNIPALLALAALALLAGCDRGETLTFSSETEEPYYREGQQLSKQGRNQEALNAYLKVIAKRDDTAPESHLEAGLILQRHMKDPIAATYHFRRYLELQPNARQAVYVRGLIENARREFARTLPATPLESQAERLETQDQIDRLLRENDQLKAELKALQAGVPAPAVVSRGPLTSAGGPVITVPAAPVEQAAAPADDSPVTYAPVESPPDEAPRVQRVPLPAGTRMAPTKPSSAAALAASAGRRHTVAKGDTLFSLAQKYYGNRSRWRDIYEANRDVLPSENSLRLGMQIKIPQ